MYINVLTCAVPPTKLGRTENRKTEFLQGHPSQPREVRKKHSAPDMARHEVVSGVINGAAKTHPHEVVTRVNTHTWTAQPRWQDGPEGTN